MDDNSLGEARLLILSETKPLPSLDDIQTAFEARASSSLLLGLGCYNDDEEEEAAAMQAAFDVSLPSNRFHRNHLF
jgi:pre-mRNA-splicing factor CDC5/CEF1